MNIQLEHFHLLGERKLFHYWITVMPLSKSPDIIYVGLFLGHMFYSIHLCIHSYTNLHCPIYVASWQVFKSDKVISPTFSSFTNEESQFDLISEQPVGQQQPHRYNSEWYAHYHQFQILFYPKLSFFIQRKHYFYFNTVLCQNLYLYYHQKHELFYL